MPSRYACAYDQGHIKKKKGFYNLTDGVSRMHLDFENVVNESKQAACKGNWSAGIFSAAKVKTYLVSLRLPFAG